MEVTYPHVLGYRMRVPRNPKAKNPGEFDWARTKNFFKDPHDEAIYQKYLGDLEQGRMELEQYLSGNYGGNVYGDEADDA